MCSFGLGLGLCRAKSSYTEYAWVLTGYLVLAVWLSQTPLRMNEREKSWQQQQAEHRLPQGEKISLLPFSDQVCH